MKRILCLVMLMLAAWGSGSLQAASLHDYPNIAVLPYANKAAVSQQLSLSDASLVSEFVIEQLLDTNRFNIIEREALEAVMKEHSFNMSGVVDSMTAVQLGRLAGVKYLVAGSVTGLSAKKSGTSVSDTAVGGTAFNKNTVIANVTARIIEVETGRILLAASGTGESASTNMEFVLRKNQKAESNDTNTIINGINVVQTTTDTNSGDMTVAGSSSVNTGTTVWEGKIVIGTKAFSQVQVRNALYKAVTDLIYNKNFGILAKLDGKAKRRKV